MAFWCNGAKRICDDCDNLCAGCKDFDGTGGQDIEIVTNADRIRSMSDEELCEMLTIGTGGFDCGTCRDSNACDRECELHCAEWLKQPMKDGDNDGR